MATRVCWDITKLKYVLVQNRLKIIRISCLKKIKHLNLLNNDLPGLGENYAATQDPVPWNHRRRFGGGVNLTRITEGRRGEPMTVEPIQETPNPAVRGGFSAIRTQTGCIWESEWCSDRIQTLMAKITRCVMQLCKTEALILIWNWIWTLSTSVQSSLP